MLKKTAPQTALLMTGNELMSGDILDSNYMSIAKTLIDIGMEIQEKVTVGDNLSLLIEQIKRLNQYYDVIIINGGLGPTSDDLTAEAMALAFGQDLRINPDASQHLQRWCEKRQIQLTDSNLKQALLPADALIFNDAPGSAPAFRLQTDKTLVIATPGVPHELKTIMYEKLVPFLQKQYALEEHPNWHVMTLFGIGESPLQELVNQSSVSDKAVLFGYRAYLPYIEFKYRISEGITTEQRHEIQKNLINLIAPFHVGLGKTTIAQTLSHILKKQQKTLSAAESCTGGLVAHYMTKLPGASQVFAGGAVTYSNALKSRLLSVSEETLRDQGAVSKATALEMLTGVLTLTGTDVALAVTGIAGPDGATEQKPVGTVYIAWGTLASPRVIRLCIQMPRLPWQKVVATVALDLVRHELVNQSIPDYMSRWQVDE